MYLGFFLVMTTTVLFIVLFAVNFREAIKAKFFTPRQILWKTLSLAGCILLLLPLTIPYLTSHKQTGDRNFADTFLTVPLPSSYFFATSRSITWKCLSTFGINLTPQWFDQQIFIGAIPLLAFAVALIFFFRKNFIRNNKSLFSISLALLLCILITMRFGNFTLFKWVFMIPGFYSIGCVPRIMNIYIGLFVIVLCLIMNIIVKRKKVVWFSLLLVAVIVDNLSRPNAYFTLDKEDVQNRLKSLVTQVNYTDHNGKIAFAYLSDKDEKVEIQMDAMMVGQLVHMPCINGYSPMCPNGYGDFWMKTDEQSLYQWLDLNNIDHSQVIIVR